MSLQLSFVKDSEALTGTGHETLPRSGVATVVGVALEPFLSLEATMLGLNFNLKLISQQELRQVITSFQDRYLCCAIMLSNYGSP